MKLVINPNYNSDINMYNNKASRSMGGTLFDKQIWRVDDVAKYLGCSIGHIYNLVSNERIPRVKKGKFLYFIPEHIFEWLLEGELE